MRYLLFLIIIGLTTLAPVHAQYILQDNKGQTSLNLNPGNDKSDKDATKKETASFGLGQIKLSTSEKKFELNYYHYFRKDKRPPSFVGVSASGEMENSFGSLFSSGNVTPGGTVKVRYGIRLFKRHIEDFDTWESKFRAAHAGKDPADADIAAFVYGQPTASDLWLVSNAGFSGSGFKWFHPDSAYNKQLESVSFSSPEFNIGLNYWSARIFNCVSLIGATIGIKKTNNFDDLSESTSEEITVRTDPRDSSTRKVTEKNVVYKGDYKETTSYPLNVDIYFKPQHFDNVAFLVYGHHAMFKGEKPLTKLGAGVYFLRKNNLFDPVFGINIDYKDVFNNAPDDTQSKWSKVSVGFVTDLETLLFQKK